MYLTVKELKHISRTAAAWAHDFQGMAGDSIKDHRRAALEHFAGSNSESILEDIDFVEILFQEEQESFDDGMYDLELFIAYYNDLCQLAGITGRLERIFK